MRKVTKSAIVCDKCGSTLKSEEYDSFCDNCTNKICSKDSFRVGIFWKDGSDADDVEFCTLKCMREWLLKFPYNKDLVEFITLPYIHDIDDLRIFLNDK